MKDETIKIFLRNLFSSSVKPVILSVLYHLKKYLWTENYVLYISSQFN